MPKTVKGGLLRFFNIDSVAKFQKNEVGPFGVFKKILKKMRKFNSLIVMKNLKKKPFGNF